MAQSHQHHQRNTSRHVAQAQAQARQRLGSEAHTREELSQRQQQRQTSNPNSNTSHIIHHRSYSSEKPDRESILKANQSPPDSPHTAVDDPYFAETTPVPPSKEWSNAPETENGSIGARLDTQSNPMSYNDRSTTDLPPPPPTWTNMPNKGQLAILAASRFVDFAQMAALQTFMVHQLKSFDPELSDVTISHQAGVLQGAFTAAQIITSILWGRAADHPMLGRKSVLMIGLVGTAIGCIGVGFSTTYQQAVFWRFMSGAINGTVGSARTMVAECTPKPWHPRAFLLLPAAFNVANVAGPILAGLLTDPTVNLPRLFGPNSTFGGAEGVLWMQRYPYAAANLISTVLLLIEAAIVHFGLKETLKGRVPMDISKFDPLTIVRNAYSQVMQMKDQGYRMLQQSQREGLLSGQEGRGSVEMDRLTTTGEKHEIRPVQRLAFSRIWTTNVLWTLLSIAIFDFHMGAFANLWILFLATPREFVSADEPVRRRSMFKFSSGLAFPPPTIGFAMAIIGFIGVALQFLLYPWANGRFGLMRCFRGSLFFFPAAYYLAPYLALLPSTTAAPEPSSGVIIWLGISFVLFLQVAARTFALPASIILLNNSSPHPSVLATIHGIGNACSALFRTIGPMLAGYWFGIWTERGIVGMAWWIVATIAAFGCIASFKVRNGSGHEIFLPGEEDEMKASETGQGSGDGR
ncbi:Major facilitator superfamily multidrug transporter mfsB [Pseudocercospora fuligena]|uniref:Major facilitator superfamily multidrug transporter mfsB n=1 Tax=Pseudocercospora fuligena TaxID=685502 RepID=A0A8H6RBI4_9PEZI|nr:Major facilitator superfamily multidrug transporter mfsB [Pseudocercospora fuligena]